MKEIVNIVVATGLGVIIGLFVNATFDFATSKIKSHGSDNREEQ